MRAQSIAEQRADHLVPRPDPHLEPVIVEFAKQAFGQSQADGLLGHRFCFHITDIIDIICGVGIILADITDVVNGGISRQEKSQ